MNQTIPYFSPEKINIKLIQLSIAMKKFLTLSFVALLALAAKAQSSFSDDFESYANGAKIAASSPIWETWGSPNGGTDDAPVSTDKAHSGTKSLKILATAAAGGPADVVLKFGGAHNAGDFTLDMWMYVVAGKEAYFNLQSETAIGSVWAVDFFFNKNGTFRGVSAGTQVISDVVYPQGQWFNYKLVVDVTNNIWTILIDGVPSATWDNPNNKIASIDLYALGDGEIGHYYIDDFSYSYAPANLSGLDGAMYGINSRRIGLAGMTIPVSGTIRNTGIDPITSFDVAWSNGVSSQTSSVTGVNIPSLGLYSFTHNVPYTLIGGNQTLTFSLANVNGGADGNAANNNRSTPVKGYVPAPNKAVVVEEATGTWCQWCPRGAVYLDSMSHLYPAHFIPIAVHNGDPMTNDEYDGGLTSFPAFTGFPSVVIDRTILEDPSGVELPFLESVTIATPVTFNTGASFDAATGVLTASTEATFSQALNDEYRLNMVITEDGVKGTGSTYNQSNAYAGGGSGIMGGFELLPSSVPAALLTYNHVARQALGGFAGVAGSLPLSIAAGSKHGAVFSYTFDNNDIQKMHLISMLIGPNGEIVNAKQVTVEEAIANGLSDATDIVVATSVEIAPNPASDKTYIRLTLEQSSETSVRLFNSMGQLVGQRNYGTLAGAQVLPLVTSGLISGVYNVQIMVGTQVIGKKIVVE